MKKTKFLVLSALVAAAYAVSTLVLAPISFGAVQLRLSEALTILPVFTPAAIPGLAIGCFISNIMSPFGIIDMVFGTLATLLAAIFTYKLRYLKYKGIPLLSPLPPVLFNAFIVGTVTAFGTGAFLSAFFISFGLIFISQLIVCYLGGIPLYIGISKLIKSGKINIF